MAYGKDSPYRNLLKETSSIMLIDVTFYNSMFHMVELDANVPYRKKLNSNLEKNNLNYLLEKKITYTLITQNLKSKKIKRLIKKSLLINCKLNLLTTNLYIRELSNFKI